MIAAPLGVKDLAKRGVAEEQHGFPAKVLQEIPAKQVQVTPKGVSPSSGVHYHWGACELRLVPVAGPKPPS